MKKLIIRVSVLMAMLLGLSSCGLINTNPDVALYNADGTPIVPGQTATPSNGDAPAVQSTFFIYLASTEESGEFSQPMQDTTNGTTYYLSTHPLITYDDLDNAVPVKDPDTNQSFALLTLNAKGAQRLLTATSRKDEGLLLVVTLQQQMISVIQITQALSTQLRIPASSAYRAYQIVQEISDGD